MNFEALGGPRSWMGGSSFGADADSRCGSDWFAARRRHARKAQRRLRSGRKSSAHRRFHRYAPSTSSDCWVSASSLCQCWRQLGTHINLGLPLRIGGIFAVALAVAAAVQIAEWVMCAQVALGLGLFGLGCFGPTDAIVDIFFCCVFGFLIAFIAGMQAENFKAARACRDDFEETDKFVRQLRFLRRGRCVRVQRYLFWW